MELKKPPQLLASPSWLLCLYFAVPPSASKPLNLDVAHIFPCWLLASAIEGKALLRFHIGGVGATGRGALGTRESLNQGSLSSAEVSSKPEALCGFLLNAESALSSSTHAL